MSGPYEFAEEIGLMLRASYPVRRNGKKVRVKTANLTVNELVSIMSACSSVSSALGQLALKKSQRESKDSLLKAAPEEREEHFYGDGQQFKIRGRWRYWRDLTPAEQAVERQKNERWLHSA